MHEFKAVNLPVDQKKGKPLERGLFTEDRVFRSGGDWYYQYRGYPEAWGPFPTAEAAEAAAKAD